MRGVNSRGSASLALEALELEVCSDSSRGRGTESSRPTTSGLIAAPLILSLVGVEVPGPTLVPMVAPAGAETPARVELRVDTEALGSEGEPLANKISEAADEVVTELGFAEPSESLDPVVTIVIERTGDDENPGYVVGFSIEKGEDIVPGSARQADCALCTRGELVATIEAELPSLLELVREHQVPAAVGGEEGGEDGGGEETKAIGPLGFAGIGVAVLGAAGGGVGAAFAVRGVVPDEPGASGAGQALATNYRTPGIATVAIGGVVLVAGLVMLAIDVSKRKKARSSASSTTGSVEPRGLGIVF